MKARPCGHVYSAASVRAYFKGPGGKKCAVFGCDKVLKWSDFVDHEASEIALRATTQGHVPHQPLSDPYLSLAAPIQAPAAPVAPPVAAVAPPAPLFQAPPPAVAAPFVAPPVPAAAVAPPVAPATTQGHVANSLDQALATHRRFHQDLLQRLREGAQFRQLIGQMQREGVQQAAASRQRQLDFLARLGSNGQAPPRDPYDLGL